MRELYLLDSDDAEENGWQERALCAQTDPEAFFPEKGGSTREAKRVCLTCDVRGECLEYALVHRIEPGVWGGASSRERRRILRKRRKADEKVAARGVAEVREGEAAPIA